jgi:hypothetical protein
VESSGRDIIPPPSNDDRRLNRLPFGDDGCRFRASKRESRLAEFRFRLGLAGCEVDHKPRRLLMAGRDKPAFAAGDNAPPS